MLDVKLESESIDNNDHRQDDRLSGACLSTVNNCLTVHVEQQTQESWHSCRPQCQTYCSSRKTLWSHMSIDRGKHRCAECDKCFESVKDLARHGRSHSGQKPLECSVCGKRLLQLSDVVRHSRVVHSGGETQHKCLLCSDGFSLSEHLNIHTTVDTAEKSYNCSVCNTSFTKLSELDDHIRNAHSNTADELGHDEKTFQCSVCGRRFRTLRDRVRHERMHRGEKPYKCDEIFSEIDSLKNHISIDTVHAATEEDMYSCSECEKHFPSLIGLHQHMNIHRYNYKCAKCGKSFGSQIDLGIHERRSHTGVRSLKCGVCSKQFASFADLNAHSTTHHSSEKSYRCCVCDKMFSDSVQLNNHVEIHSTGKPYKYLLCDKSFSDPSNLRRHKRCIHGSTTSERNELERNDNFILECTVCNKHFKTTRDLVRHGRIHSGQKPYKCHMCDRVFNRHESLKVHMRVHTGEKPHKCSECNNCFSHLCTLEKHKLRVHSNTVDNLKQNEIKLDATACSKRFATSHVVAEHDTIDSGEKSYRCYLCDKVFSQSKSLKVHIGGHTGERPYMCAVCSKRFTQSSDLARHNRIHSGEKPYKCLLCTKTFNQSGSLKIHMRVHTGEKPYSCSLCKKNFTKSSHLHSHRRRTHANTVGLIQPGCENDQFKCAISSDEFTSTSDLAVHSGQKPCECDMSVMALSDSEHLSNHIQTQSTDETRNGSLCFSDRCKRRVHSNTTNELKQDDASLECPVCSKRFKRSRDVARHGRIHTGDKPYVCYMCDKAFNRPETLKVHIRVHVNTNAELKQGESKYQCGVCGKQFKTSRDLARHDRTHTGEKPYKCDVCYRAFSELGAVKVHMRVHTGEKPYKCSLCDKTYSHSSTLYKHRRRAHITATDQLKQLAKFSCAVCSKQFTTSHELVRHNRTHTGEKPYKCPMCVKAFRESGSLTNHMRVHAMGQEMMLQCSTLCNSSFTDSNTLHTHNCLARSSSTTDEWKPDENVTFQCDVSSKQLTSSYDLDSTTGTTHSTEKPHKCCVCDKVFSQSGTLKIHMRVHTGEKPYTCLLCDKRFTQNSSLQTHNLTCKYRVRSDTADELKQDRQVKSECPVCSKQFIKSSDLVRHSRIHSGEKPYKCSVCSKTFRQSSAMQQHRRRMHSNCRADGAWRHRSGKVMYECDVCSKRFVTPSDFARHKRIHSGEKPCKCDVCHEAFSQSSHLKVHMRVHTRETPYKCLMCDKAFSHSSSLQKHQRVHIPRQ